jgi:hypothetical protein
MTSDMPPPPPPPDLPPPPPPPAAPQGAYGVMPAPVVVREGGGLATPLVILSLILCGPLGLVLVLFTSWKKETKLAVFGVYLVVILLLIFVRR